MLANRVVQKLERLAYRATRNSAQLNSLFRKHPRTAHALKEVLDCRLMPEERHFVDRIEVLRKQLNQCNDKVDFLDFGAGRPGDVRTRTDHVNGVKASATVGEVASAGSKRFTFGLLLLKLIRASQPSRCVELGTCLGISAAYQAAALELNGRGTLITLEGAEPLAQRARVNLEKLGLSKRVEVVIGRFDDTLEEVSSPPIEFAFIDGNHEYDATLRYWNRLSSVMPEGSVAVFDDICSYEGMVRAWAQLKRDRRFVTVIDLFAVGIGVVGSGSGPEEFRISIG